MVEFYDAVDYIIEDEGIFPVREDSVLSSTSVDDLLDMEMSEDKRFHQQQQPIDLPTLRKHYGNMQIDGQPLPIIYRLWNGNYVAYAWHSYAVNVIRITRYNKYWEVRNLPTVNMTQNEENYYMTLCQNLDMNNNSMCSIDEPKQLISCAILDYLLAVIDIFLYYRKNPCKSNDMQEAMRIASITCEESWLRRERDVLDMEQNSRRDSTHNGSACIPNIMNRAEKRSYFEERLDISIVDNVGGFLQLHACIYPYIECHQDGQFYVNYNDLKKTFKNILELFEPFLKTFSSDSIEFIHYKMIIEQSDKNISCTNLDKKIFPYYSIRREKFKYDDDVNDKYKFISLYHLLLIIPQYYFVQIFDTSKINEIEEAYLDELGRIFLMSQYDGGIIRCSTDNTYFMPCLSTTRNRKKTTWIPTLENNVDDTDRIRLATDTERLYISMLKLHEGKFRREEEMYLELYDEHEDYQILKFEKYHSHRRQELLKMFCNSKNNDIKKK